MERAPPNNLHDAKLFASTPPKGQSLLDMGCGTGVLAILAEKLGAEQIYAIDVEPWCYQNTVENIATNGCQHIIAAQGDESNSPKEFHTILANINMNVLLWIFLYMRGNCTPKDHYS